MLHAYRWLDAAAALYRRAMAIAPGEARWPHLLGRIILETGTSAEATQLLERATALDPRDFSARLLLGEIALRAPDLAAARAHFEKAAAAMDRPAQALSGWGEALRLEGRTGEAKEKLEAARALDPTHGPTLHRLALLARARGDAGEERALLAEHAGSRQRIEPDDPLLAAVESLRRDADQAFRRAGEQFRSGQLAEAARSYAETLERRPTFSLAHYNLARTLDRLGRHAEALPHHGAFLEAEPGSPDGWNNYGLCLLALGKKGDAAIQLARAANLDPGYAPARINLAPLLLEQGDFEGATRRLLEVLRSEPANPRALDLLLSGAPAEESRHRKLAAFLLGQGLARSAVEALRRVSPREDPGQRNTVALAWILATTADDTVRDPREALRLLEPVLAGAQTPDATLLDAWGVALAANGRFEEAVKTLERALRESPENKRDAAIEARLELFRSRKPYRRSEVPGG